MNKLWIFLSFFFFLYACKKNEIAKNPYLEDVNFSVEINLDLPEYISLKYANNSVLIHNAGIKGIIVFNNGNGYNAFEASDPNHYPNNCSQMQPNQFTCTCNCEDNQYSLYTGQITHGDGKYSLKPYHISQSGNRLRISN
jgi:nitrite reductase/ring-hydroxylating ferredoxin subunit